MSLVATEIHVDPAAVLLVLTRMLWKYQVLMSKNIVIPTE